MNFDINVINEKLGLCEEHNTLVTAKDENGKYMYTGCVAIWDNSKITDGENGLSKYSVHFYPFGVDKAIIVKFSSKEKAYAYAMKKIITLTTVKEK